MSETLTYDAGTDAVTSSENLNEAEQEALEVGEQMEAEQEQLLAGKYKNAEELEKAHIELQKKLGEKSETKAEEAEESVEPEPEAKKETPADSDILEEIWTQNENNNIQRETLEKLAKMNPLDVAKLAMQEKAKNKTAEPRQFTEQDTDNIKGLVGGHDNYMGLMGWAQNNLSTDEIKMYDEVMSLGNAKAAYFAVQALALKAQDMQGRDGKMVTGKAPTTSKDVFNSQAQVVEAMSDSRYEDDPAYRQAITEKLARSDLSF